MFRTDSRLSQFTPETLVAIERAAQSAGRFGERHIDSLAAISGLTQLRMGVSSRTLREFGVTTATLEELYEDLYSGRLFHERPVEELEFSPDLLSVVDRAIEIAEGFERPFVEDGFYLLAIAELEHTFGMRQLRRLKVDPQKLRIQLCSELLSSASKPTVSHNLNSVSAELMIA